MIIRAGTPEGIHNKLVDESGKDILAVWWDTEERMAGVLAQNPDGSLIVGDDGENIINILYLPNARLVPV